MNIPGWIRDRKTKGTLADLARRIMSSDQAYGDADAQLRQLYVLEALIANDGKHEATAAALKIHRHTVNRALRALGLTSVDVKAIAKQINK